jgi:hypothetical protein
MFCRRLDPHRFRRGAAELLSALESIRRKSGRVFPTLAAGPSRVLIRADMPDKKFLNHNRINET